MTLRQPALPRLWLMTDARMGEALLPAIAALPRGSGVLFRHYGLGASERRALLRTIRRAARGRHLILDAAKAHGRHPGAITAPVHGMTERIAAERTGVRAIFVSPVFATSSHPGARPLGRVRFGLLVRGCRLPVIALGGMAQKRARSLKLFGVYGWAAIDGLTPKRQKRKAVPT